MSKLRKFKSWFIEEDPRARDEAESTPASTPTAPKATAKPAAPSATPSPGASKRPGQISERFTDVLLDAMEAANQPGFDYLEFKKAVENLKAMNMDDSTRFKSAYAMAQSMNISPQQLVQSAKHYLAVLGDEDRKFQAALQGQEQLQVASRQENAAQLDKERQQIDAEIKKLQARLAAIQQQQATLQAEISEAAGKLNDTQADFQLTYQTIAKQIQHDIQQMETYLA